MVGNLSCARDAAGTKAETGLHEVCILVVGLGTQTISHQMSDMYCIIRWGQALSRKIKQSRVIGRLMEVEVKVTSLNKVVRKSH